MAFTPSRRPARKRKRRHFASSERSRESIAAPPGMLDVDPAAPKPQIRVMAYGPDRVEERTVTAAPELSAFEAPVRWIDVVGLGDAPTLLAIAERFGIHPLALEDVVHQHQRPKVELYDSTLFIILRAPDPGEGGGFEQISLFLGADFVLTFQEGEADCFGAVRERIRSGKGKLRGSSADHLAYSLLDATIDHYFPLVDAVAEDLDAVESAVISSPGHEALSRLLALKRTLLTLRRYVRPLRDVVAQLQLETMPFVTPETRVYLRDCHDHTVQLIDLVEMQRDLTVSLMELHMSVSSQRMNEIMKVLTIISTIFIPLSFIAGVYGMNFHHMPELDWTWGYPLSLALMGGTAAAFLLFFRRRGWIGPENPERIADLLRESTPESPPPG